MPYVYCLYVFKHGLLQNVYAIANFAQVNQRHEVECFWVVECDRDYEQHEQWGYQSHLKAQVFGSVGYKYDNYSSEQHGQQFVFTSLVFYVVVYSTSCHADQELADMDLGAEKDSINYVIAQTKTVGKVFEMKIL